jgi:hypothetical protein
VVTEVVFSDRTVWRAGDEPWGSLSEPQLLCLDRELLKQYRLRFGQSSIYVPHEEKDLWYCTCGALNHIGEGCRCGNSLFELQTVDMAELARRDPQALARLHATAHSNGQALDALRGRSTQLERNLANAEAQRTGQRVACEVQDALEAVLPRIAKLVGEGFERKAFKLDIARYLLEQGVPAEAVCAMSRGYELELCTKAMLFDRMQGRRAEAEAKLADLPAVHSPRRAGLDEGDKLGRARAALNKNPNSTEALAALFAAM